MYSLTIGVFRELMLFYKYVPFKGEVERRKRNLCV